VIASSIVEKVRSVGGTVRLDGDRLRITAPSGTVDRQVLADHRLELLRLLAHERIAGVLERFAAERPRSYSSIPDAGQWDRLEGSVDEALRSGSGIGEAIKIFEQEGLALLHARRMHE
jgi:hypothetical protein